MTPREEVIRELDRLRRLAAACHVVFPPAEATRAEVEQFALDTGSPVGADLVEFWLARKYFVVMMTAPRIGRFDATPFDLAKRDWFGYEREITHRFGPKAGQTVNYRFPGTSEVGTVSLASDGCGDEMYLLLRDGSHGRAGQVVWYDYETDEYTVVADSLAGLLRASNDLVERNPNLAFFYGDEKARIFQFPGTDELRRQLDAGLSPDEQYGAFNLVGTALSRGRDDLFQVLVARGADKNDALLQTCGPFRPDLAEQLLAAGADPAVRLPDGRTLLAYEALAGKPRTVALLMRFGARGRLPLDEFDRLVAAVRDSDRIAERKKGEVLRELGQ